MHARMDGAPAVASRAPSAIVGRDAPLARLYRLVEHPRSGVCQIVGEAGLGKTRLAEAALAWAEVRGRTVLRGNADPGGAQTPLGCLQDALRSAKPQDAPARAEDPVAREFLIRLLPELGLAPGSRWDQGTLLAAAARYLDERRAVPGSCSCSKTSTGPIPPPTH
jgi:hypothetical protein